MRIRRPHIHRSPARAAAIALVLLSLLAAATAMAAPQSPAATGIVIRKPEMLQLATRKSVVIEAPAPVSRLSLASPDFADVLIISPRQIYLTGKAPGATTLTLWGRDDVIMAVYEVMVSPDLMHIKQMLHMVLPQETDIRVISTGDKVSLSGTVSSAANLSTAVSLAEAAAPDNVVNLLQVGGVHQVMLEVRVAEMSRSVTKRMGINLGYIANNFSFYTFLNGLSAMGALDGATAIGSNVNGLIQSTRGSTSVNVFLDALKKNGLVKILAEPNLICLSGATANFLAGGEIPVPVPAGDGNIAIEYKPFGVWLEFTPTVLDKSKINMVVRPEVSELDYDNGVTISSIVVPAVTSRRTETTIELGDGQSFAIAGLIKDNLRENANKFPVLGEVPVLGSLFRSMDYLKEQTELVIIVTPHLVKPTDMAQQTLPTDNIKEPSDFEFYMMGLIEGSDSGPAAMARNRRVTPPPSDDSAGFDGDFGHVMPN